MKKLISVSIALIVLVLSASCSKSNDLTDEPSNRSDIIVFAAASLTESLEEIKEDFESIYPQYQVLYNLDSSGTLKTQIEEGADADIFISAAIRQMDSLDPRINSTNYPIDENSRIDLLENKVVLVVPENSGVGIESFKDVGSDKVGSIALGNSDVPVGQYSEELFNSLGIWSSIEPKIVYGSNVKEVTTWVSEGVVDCGVVYQTDANAANLVVVDEAEDLLNTPVIYPAAILKGSLNREGAQLFYEYITSVKGLDVFIKNGFSEVSN